MSLLAVLGVYEQSFQKSCSKRNICFQVPASASITHYVGLSVGCSIRPHITLSAFFSAVCRRIDLKFSRDLHIDLLFQFLFFFFLNSSSSSSFSSKLINVLDYKTIALCLLDNRDIYFLPQQRN
jgi:hypothetical protein